MVLGVGTGDDTGKVDRGKTVQVKVVFRDVTQEAIYASTMQMRLEIKR